MKAYRIEWNEMPGIEVLIAATTAGRARYTGFLMASDVRRTANITQFRARRAPEYDHLATNGKDGARIFQVDEAAFRAPSSLEPGL